MGLFGFGRKDEVVDLAEKYKRQKEMQAVAANDGVDAVMNNTGSATQSHVVSSPSTQIFNSTDSALDKRRKLAKRILDMANKIDDMGNKIFLLQQRIELLEKKLGTGAAE